jgi:hypothetical protein
VRFPLAVRHARLAWCAGGVLVGADHAAVHLVHQPVQLAEDVGAAGDLGQQPVEHTLATSAAKTGDRPPGTEGVGQVPPRRACAQQPHDRSQAIRPNLSGQTAPQALCKHALVGDGRPGRTHGPPRATVGCRRLAWTLCAISVTLANLGLVYGAWNYPALDPLVTDIGPIAVLALSFPIVGALIATHRPGNPLGWIICAVGLFGGGLVTFGTIYGTYALSVPDQTGIGRRRGHGCRGQQGCNAAVLRGGHQCTDLDVIDELLTPDGVDHTFGSQSAEEAKQFFGMFCQAFPDLRVEIHDVIAEGDRVTYSGTHEGDGKQTELGWSEHG